MLRFLIIKPKLLVIKYNMTAEKIECEKVLCENQGISIKNNNSLTIAIFLKRLYDSIQISIKKMLIISLRIIEVLNFFLIDMNKIKPKKNNIE